MKILLIALVPAVIVFFIAVGTESKFKTTVAALIAAAIGVLTGNPAYMALDIIAVIVAYWLSMSLLRDETKPKPSPAQPPAVNKIDSDSNSGSTIAVVIGLGFIAYLAFGTSGNHKSPNQSPSTVNARPAAIVQPSYVTPQSAPPPPPVAVIKQATRSPKSPLQRCLEIKSEDKMTACLERLG